MIKIDYVKSSDPLIIGIYEYEFDQVFIGRSKNADIIIPNIKLPAQYLTLSVKDNSLMIQNQEGSIPFYVNEKKANGAFKLKMNDRIKFNDEEFIVINFKKSHTPVDLTPFYESLTNADPEVKKALAFIEEKLDV